MYSAALAWMGNLQWCGKSPGWENRILGWQCSQIFTGWMLPFNFSGSINGSDNDRPVEGKCVYSRESASVNRQVWFLFNTGACLGSLLWAAHPTQMHPTFTVLSHNAVDFRMLSRHFWVQIQSEELRWEEPSAGLPTVSTLSPLPTLPHSLAKGGPTIQYRSSWGFPNAWGQTKSLETMVAFKFLHNKCIVWVLVLCGFLWSLAFLMATLWEV